MYSRKIVKSILRLRVRTPPVKSASVNFTNVLRAAFLRKDPKSVKRLECLFLLLGSLRAKASHKMLVKLTPVKSEEEEREREREKGMGEDGVEFSGLNLI